MSRVGSLHQGPKIAHHEKPVTKEILVPDYGNESDWSDYTYTYIPTSTDYQSDNPEPPPKLQEPTAPVPTPPIPPVVNKSINATDEPKPSAPQLQEGSLSHSSSGEKVQLCDASVEVTLDSSDESPPPPPPKPVPKKKSHSQKKSTSQKDKPAVKKVRVKKKKAKEGIDLGKLSPRGGQRALGVEKREVEIEELKLKREVEIVDFSMPGDRRNSDSKKFLGNFTREVITNARDEAGAVDSTLSDSMIECFRVKLKLQRVRGLPHQVPLDTLVYCSVRLSDDSKEQRTKSRPASDLKWHEAFEVTCSSLGSAMYVQVKSEEPIDGDCLLAFVSLDASELPRNQRISKWFKCQDNRGEPCDCEVYLEMDCRLASEKSPAKELPSRLKLNVSIVGAGTVPHDSYTVIARIRGSSEVVRTKVVNSSRPTWNETFTLFCANPVNDYFVTILRRVDAETGDDDIAAMVLRVADIPLNVSTEKWYNMKATKGHSLEGLKIKLALRAEASNEVPRSEIVDSSVSERNGKDLLTVKVVEGKHIVPDKVYCQVKLNKQQGVLRTRVISDTKKPQWREKFTIPVDDRNKDSLCVVLRNDVKQLGYFNVPLVELSPGRTYDEWYSLVPWSQGKIRLEMRLDVASTSKSGSGEREPADGESYVIGRLQLPDDSESNSDELQTVSAAGGSSSLHTVSALKLLPSSSAGGTEASLQTVPALETDASLHTVAALETDASLHTVGASETDASLHAAGAFETDTSLETVGVLKADDESLHTVSALDSDSRLETVGVFRDE